MRLSVRESLAWLSSHGHDMKEAKYHRLKAKIEASVDKRKFNLMSKGLLEQHFERIDQLETIQKLSWENYHREVNPYRKTKILESIRTIQPLLSAYYNATQDVIEYDIRKGVRSNNDLSDNSKGESNAFDFLNS